MTKLSRWEIPKHNIIQIFMLSTKLIAHILILNHSFLVTKNAKQNIYTSNKMKVTVQCLRAT